MRGKSKKIQDTDDNAMVEETSKGTTEIQMQIK